MGIISLVGNEFKINEKKIIIESKLELTLGYYIEKDIKRMRNEELSKTIKIKADQEGFRVPSYIRFEDADFYLLRQTSNEENQLRIKKTDINPILVPDCEKYCRIILKDDLNDDLETNVGGQVKIESLFSKIKEILIPGIYLKHHDQSYGRGISKVTTGVEIGYTKDHMFVCDF